MSDAPRIDPDFHKLLPPLSVDELAELEASICDEGVREPLIVWRGLLLDGHNRLAIAEKHGLPYRQQEVDLEDREAARRWIIRNQLGRRNLTADWFGYLSGLQAAETPRDKGGRPSENSGQKVTSLQTLADDLGVDRRTLLRNQQFSEAVDAVAEVAGDEVRPTLLSGKLTRREVTKLAEVAADEPDAVREALQQFDGEKPGSARKSEAWQNIHLSQTNEWYTPAEYVEAARKVLGRIDVDPASNDQAQAEVIRAGTYYTEKDNGLTREWHGTVWLNPPWGKAQAQFVERLVSQYQCGVTTAAVLLVNAHSTDTSWFQPLWGHILCFTDHRINFYGTEGVGSTHGSVFVYLGPDWSAFAAEFARFGAVVARYHAEPAR